MIVVVGLSHKTAPIDVRERAALSDDAIESLLKELTNAKEVGEALAISTCNRMEIVAAPRNNGLSLETLLTEVADALNQRIPGVSDHLYKKAGEAALQHLFRVTSSLDSLVMGEPQILGQVKGALEFARRSGTVGPMLNRAVEGAVRAAKRVRSETAIGAGQVSVPSVAVDLAQQIFGQLEGRAAVLVGSGAMGETAAKLLTQSGARLFVVGRNRERREQLSEQLRATPRPLEDLPQALWEADVVITATSAPGYVVDLAMLERVHKKRKGRSLFLIDLAVPRDIDPRIDQLNSVFLYNVDDLSDLVNQSLSSRQREAERAQAILDSETVAFERSLSVRQVAPTVVALRAQFTSTLRRELERSLKGRLKHLQETDRAALDKMIEASVSKILHPTTRVLRQLAADKESSGELGHYTAALCELFALDSLSGDSPAPELPSQENDPSKEPHSDEVGSSEDDPALARVAAPSGTKLTKVG